MSRIADYLISVSLGHAVISIGESVPMQGLARDPYWSFAPQGLASDPYWSVCPQGRGSDPYWSLCPKGQASDPYWSVCHIRSGQ